MGYELGYRQKLSQFRRRLPDIGDESFWNYTKCDAPSAVVIYSSNPKDLYAFVLLDRASFY
jgi:hypothetical protein